MQYEIKIAAELQVKPHQVQATIELLDGGATVPFISRYRKEVTGSLDEVQVAAIRDRILQLRELEKRKDDLIKWIVQIDSEQLLGSLEELKKQFEDDALPAEISELLELSNQTSDEQLIRHTKTRNVFGKK